jgi:Protein of unknown function (DUF2637)
VSAAARWAYRASVAGVLGLTAASFVLSYDALHQLALASGVRPRLAYLWPGVIDGFIVVALLTVLAAKRATTSAAYPWTLAGLFSAASVAFNIAHAPDRPVARLVFATAPVALVLATHLLMQQVGWRRTYPADRAAGTAPGRPAWPGDDPTRPAHDPEPDDRPLSMAAPGGARARVRAAYEAELAAGHTPTGAGLARVAGVSERYGQRLLAEFAPDPNEAGRPNGASPTSTRHPRNDGHDQMEGR